jgi:SAM-dependent methyltransferase
MIHEKIVNMNMSRLIKGGLRSIPANLYRFLDWLYLPLDRKEILRTRNLRFIPSLDNRRGGKVSYAEWAHVIGIFQTVIYLHLRNKSGNVILDVGCGSGLLGIACEPFVGEKGKYFGIDVMRKDIDFCRKHFDFPNYIFKHLDINNPAYAPKQSGAKVLWPVESEEADLLTALSVWTHLNEEDALFYFLEIQRVLKPGGKAIVTAFLLDDEYQESIQRRSTEKGRYHMTEQMKWIFDTPSYGSEAWFHPNWVPVPESAIGFTQAGLKRLISNSGLKLVEHHQGNWKEIPGLFFQDILIFQKEQ